MSPSDSISLPAVDTEAPAFPPASEALINDCDDCSSRGGGEAVVVLIVVAATVVVLLLLVVVVVVVAVVVSVAGEGDEDGVSKSFKSSDAATVN